MSFLPICEKVATADTPRKLQRIEKELRELLMLKPNGYWQAHYNFGRGGARNSGLIGEERARDIVINKILPIAYLWALESESRKLQDGLLNLYTVARKLAANNVIREVDKQIFTETQPMKLLKTTARVYQGILRLHENYCADRLCDLCPIFEHDAVIPQGK